MVKKILIPIVIILIVIIVFLILNKYIKNEISNESKDLQANITDSENFVSESVETQGNVLISENIDTNNIVNEEMNSLNNEEIKINLVVNNKNFSATLENNQTVQELIQQFPITLNMSDLHSNEKYNYLDSNFTTNSNTPNMINTGDIKLYGNNCLVVFYKDFKNYYSYTNLGRVENPNEFVKELGNGNVDISFELAK